MAAPGHLGRDHVGAPRAHLGEGLGREQVGVGAADRRERRGQGLEQGPEVRHGLRAGGDHRVAQPRVVGDVEAAVADDVELRRLLGPALRGHALEALHDGGARGCGLRQRRVGRGQAEVSHDDLDARLAHDGADVDQARAREALARGGREHHGDEPAARGAEDRGALQPEVVEERQRVGALLRHGVGRGVGARRGAAAACVEPDQARVPDVGREVVEVAPVAGEAGEAQDGRALALVAKGEAGAVGGVEGAHAAISGMASRSGTTWSGRPGRRSTGAPVRFTQAVRNP